MFDDYDREERLARYENEMERARALRNPADKKRPVHRGPDGRMSPVPWVGGGFPYLGEWARINHYRAVDAETDHLCLVCGLHRGDDWVYALVFGKPSDRAGMALFNEIPSPTYGHPECILKAVLFCPHLKNQEYPAMTQDRSTKLTVDDLKKIVHEKKTLKQQPESFAVGRASIGPKTIKDYDAVR